ncbi:16S rRNA (guanine(527)-N(7))-methyltransferase RsmG [Flammeovirgaceae bacterium SG7u.111]|nr:16S rRNA (guanine(527)-N(7))-methyltransferase RsmG [Flammeovirgaceae bacterium SG7u.132]WPO33469.1 16S rRNA (guanine(527)-N(7))-methyltransferase RsmG [Flammeovirgaceae bacterium SG7u.111]
MEIIEKYFPELSEEQKKQFALLDGLYRDWNQKINVISRKDIDNLYTHHILHSLAIAKFVSFAPETAVLDIGTGGGFPGIPLAILFPEVKFHLVDSIMKKIKVVNEVSGALELKNVRAEQNRVEQLKGRYDFAVTRAVASITDLWGWVGGKLGDGGKSSVWNGLICLKGGDLNEELDVFKRDYRTEELSSYFEEPFFETKKIVYAPMMY